LIAKKTPGQLTEIGIGAAVYGLDAFLAALLKHGLDPNASNAQGRTTLSAAESHGKDSAVYRLVKAMAEGKR
jgi:ankyrin repeat protein